MKKKNVLCLAFFEELKNGLEGKYETMGSCNNDISQYLCPIGTFGEVTYESKPELSFRVSDHWNWYANTIKCPNPRYIQCYSEDLPWAPRRHEEGKAGKNIKASCVCLYKDGKYHVVFGEKFNRKTKEWSWIDSNVSEVLAII